MITFTQNKEHQQNENLVIMEIQEHNNEILLMRFEFVIMFHIILLLQK